MAIGTKGKGNFRKGRVKGYRGQKGGAHATKWQSDNVILERIKAGLQPWMERRSVSECLEVVNQYVKVRFPDEPPISVSALFQDRQRAQELYREQVHSTLFEHLAEQDAVLKEAWSDMHKLHPGHARNILMGTISQIVERKAKMDGSLIEKNVLAVTGTVDHNVNVAPLNTEEMVEAMSVLYEHSPKFRDAWDKRNGPKVIEAAVVDMETPPALSTELHNPVDVQRGTSEAQADSKVQEFGQ